MRSRISCRLSGIHTLGFPGFLLWSGIQYVLTPLFWQRYADQQTTLLYLCELGYMTVTYLTDNTASYHWLMMVSTYSKPWPK